MDIDSLKQVIAWAVEILFSMKEATIGGEKTKEGVVPFFLDFLGKEPILLLPMGFYLVFMGLESTRKLIRGY